MRTIGQKEFLKLLDQIEVDNKISLPVSLRGIEYGQWEVPFEAFLIQLMKNKKSNIEIDFEKFDELAKESGLKDDGGVLDPKTWRYFCAWTNR